jgi:hypothetical protein
MASKNDIPDLPPIDAEAILETLAEIRKSVPQKYMPEKPSTPGTDGRAGNAILQPQSLREFDYLAVVDGLESLASDLSEASRIAQEKVLADALHIYYTAEELAKDPEHADLIPHVEKMRQAYLNSYGTPVPPNPNKKKE